MTQCYFFDLQLILLNSVRFCVDDDGQRGRRQQHQAQQEAGAGDAAESEQPQLLLSVQHLHGGRHGVYAGKNIGLQYFLICKYF